MRFPPPHTLTQASWPASLRHAPTAETLPKHAATSAPAGPLSDTSDGAAHLSPAERRALLEDIALIGLALGREIASAPPYSLSLSLGSLTPEITSPLERLRLLEALWPQIQAALGALTRRPDSALCVTAQSVPLAQSRGGPAVATRLATTPAGLAAWAMVAKPLPNDSARRRQPRCLSEMRPHPTTETYANRLAVTLLDGLVWEAAALAALAAFCGEAEEAARMRRIAEAAARWRANACLCNLPPLAPRERPLRLLAAHAIRSAPPYRALFGLWRQLNLPLRFDWAGSPLLCLPSLEPWRLYEIWCYLRVAAALQTNGWRAIGGNVVRWEPDGLRLALAVGGASRLRFARNGAARRNGPVSDTGPRAASEPEALELFYQPLFPSANQSARRARPEAPEADSLRRTGIEPRFASLSHAMQPDIALRWRGRLSLLDAKFRTYALPLAAQADPGKHPGAEDAIIRQSTALLEDVDKMHTYRDAIVGEGRPVVDSAWCLFPGLPEEGPPIVAYPASTPQQPFGTAGVGALRLRPSANHALLTQLLAQWLAD